MGRSSPAAKWSSWTATTGCASPKSAPRANASPWPERPDAEGVERIVFRLLIFAMKNLSYSNLIYACLGFIGLMLSVGVAQAFRSRRRVGRDEAPASDQALRQEIEAMRSVLAEVRQRAEDQERRIKWLERQPRTA